MPHVRATFHSYSDEDTAMSITTHHEADIMIGDLISYCRGQKFNDAIGYLEKASKKIRNASIEEQANSTTISMITNFFPVLKTRALK